MPPLDHATLQAVLDKQGMPNTTENLNRIAQFAAVAPDMLDKYLGRGTDQSRLDSTDAAIDRSIASTADPRLAQLAGPNPYSATLDPNTGLTNIGPGLVKGPAEPRGTVTVGQPKLASIPGDENRPVGAPPFPKGPTTTGQQTESETDRPSKGQPTPPTQAGETRPEGGSWTNYIVPSILALFAAQVARRGAGGTHVPPPNTPPIGSAIPKPGGVTPTVPPTVTPNVPPPTVAPHMPPPAPQGPAYVPGGVPQTAPIVPGPQPYTGGPQGPHMPTPPNTQPPYMPPPNRAGQTPADIARLKAEVEAENAARLQEEMRARAIAQPTPAQQTVGAAKRATGRQP
jgi:hypothetical protein